MILVQLNRENVRREEGRKLTDSLAGPPVLLPGDGAHVLQSHRVKVVRVARVPPGLTRGLVRHLVARPSVANQAVANTIRLLTQTGLSAEGFIHTVNSHLHINNVVVVVVGDSCVVLSHL